MKLFVAGAVAAALAAALATPVLAAQSGEDEAAPSVPSSSATERPGAGASDQGLRSSARGRAHRDAMKAWRVCVSAEGKDACPKPAPPGRAEHQADPKKRGPGPGPASEQGKGHGYGRAHAPGQLKDKSAGTD